MDKLSPYINYIEKLAAEKRKKKDPYAMTKIVGLTNLIGIPGDMAFDYTVEGLDIFRRRNKARVGNNIIKALTTPYAKNRFKTFTSRQGFTALPMSIGVAGLMTLPIFISEHNALHKKAAENENDFGKDGKIPVLERAFASDPIGKKVAYMIATSHEYKKPNIKAALMFTKNYSWELSKCKISDMQGIDKPIDDAKVEDMAKNMKEVKPFVVVNQLDAIRPQTPGKKILIDGHHRKEACKKQGKEEVPVYKGIYTGGAGKPLEELKIAYEVINEVFEKFASLKEGFHIERATDKGYKGEHTKLNIVDEGGNVAGYSVVRPDPAKRENTVALSELYINPKFRGMGLASELIETAKAENSGKNVVLRALPYKDKAVDKDTLKQIYNKHGFETIHGTTKKEQKSDDIMFYKAAEIINEAFEKKASREDKYMNKIRKAGNKHTMVHINYKDKKGASSERDVEPYKISGDSFWGYDPAKEGIRRFKVPQLSRVQITNKKYDPRWSLELGEIVKEKREKPTISDNPGQLDLFGVVKNNEQSSNV